MVVIIVFLVVIGFLINAKRDEALYREMKAEEKASEMGMMAVEDTIVVEGEIDEEMFKPPGDVQETIVEVAEDQEVEMTDSEVGVGEGEMEGK